jgi:hypothetical protein
MKNIDTEGYNEAQDYAERGLLANEMLRHDVYSLPDEEDALVFCPDCGELGETFGSIEHRSWCYYGEQNALACNL